MEGLRTPPLPAVRVLPAVRGLSRGPVLALVALLVSAAVLCAGCGGDSPSGPVVTTTGGPVRGVTDGDIASFYGIPYAAPPVGNLRWHAPTPAPAWSGTRDGAARGKPCPQLGTPADRSSEDCLFVNVTAPRAGLATAASTSATAGAGRPVLVWIHGGGFVSGTANQPNLVELAAAGPAVVVAVNYRLGPLGHLALPALNSESGGDAGTYALADLVLALRWVRDNAAAFGGDPGKVTIFGESAGGVNVCALLAAPSAAGLFQRAITQSGPCLWRLPTTAAAERTGQDFAASLGCTDPADVVRCLRAVPAERIAAASGQVDVLANPRWAPVVGGPTLPRAPADAIADGSAMSVPVILGTVRDEGRAFLISYDPDQDLTAEQFAEMIRQQVPDRADAVLAAYPPGFAPPRERLAQVITDRFFACPTARTAELLAAGGAPVYLYEFDVPGMGPMASGVSAGATHASELAYLFPGASPDGSDEQGGSEERGGSAGSGAFDPGSAVLGSPGSSSAADRRALSLAMRTYWTRFAATGDPNVASSGGAPGRAGAGTARPLPSWPAWPGLAAWPADAAGSAGAAVVAPPVPGGVPDRLALEPGAIGPRAGYAAAHHCDLWR